MVYFVCFSSFGLFVVGVLRCLFTSFVLVLMGSWICSLVDCYD